MGLSDIVRSLLMETKEIDIKSLPSQGFFYKSDFNLKIKKADLEDIVEYEYNFDKTNLISAIECIKKVVSKNVVLNGYEYVDIKSVDVIFLFLEIVKFTTKKEIKIPYTNDSGDIDFINFGFEHFNYFNFNEYMKFYNDDSKEIIIDGYRFSLPTIGVETCLTQYLGSKSDKDEVDMLNKASYDFMFFLGNKNNLSFNEIDNLIQIFNFDLDEDENARIRKIVDGFRDVVGYSLLSDGKQVEIKTKINLQDIWKIK